MAAQVFAIIAALKKLETSIDESGRDEWPVSSINRWISQLDDSTVENRDELLLAADLEGDMASADLLLSHVQSTIAFLETLTA